jgi:hypothetical protein
MIVMKGNLNSIAILETYSFTYLPMAGSLNSTGVFKIVRSNL